MKAQNRWLGLLAAMVMPLSPTQAQTTVDVTDTPASPGAVAVPTLSAKIADVVRMAEAGTSEEVLLAFIQNSTTPFGLSTDQILYLRDSGLSSPVIAAMLNSDTSLRTQPQSSADGVPAQSPALAVESVPLPAPPTVETPDPAPVYAANPPVEVRYFYNDLSPYGTWVQLDGVGWCWQPRAVAINRGWRPYCDSGHWACTDAGWCWQSDYSWGWAPFHYGRWYLHDRCGWVWTPDRVWGPAWVTWRTEGDYCGWAPLPPHADFDLHLGYRFNGLHVGLDFDFGLRPDHFAFISLNHFHDHDFAHRRLPSEQVNQIFNHTTIINNYAVNNNNIVNQGISADRVARATHTEVRRLPIRDLPAGASPATGARSIARTELPVYRPELRTPERPISNMVAQKVDERHPVIQHAPVNASNTARPTARDITSAGASAIAPSLDHRATGRSEAGSVARTSGSPSIPAFSGPNNNSSRGATQYPSTAAPHVAQPVHSPAQYPPGYVPSRPTTLGSPSSSSYAAPAHAASRTASEDSQPVHSQGMASHAPLSPQTYHQPNSFGQNSAAYATRDYFQYPSAASHPAQATTSPSRVASVASRSNIRETQFQQAPANLPRATAVRPVPTYTYPTSRPQTQPQKYPQPNRPATSANPPPATR